MGRSVFGRKVAAKLFRRLEKRRGAGAELLAQSGFLGLGGGEMPLLDLAEAADFFRNRSQFNRDVMIVRRQMFA